MGPGAPRDSQSRAYRWQREPALRRDIAESRTMGGAGAVRRNVLRSRRYGEPDQRAVQFVCRSGERGNDAGQPTAAVLLGNGLCAGQRITAARIESNRVCASASSNNSYEVAE